MKYKLLLVLALTAMVLAGVPALFDVIKTQQIKKLTQDHLIHQGYEGKPYMFEKQEGNFISNAYSLTITGKYKWTELYKNENNEFVYAYSVGGIIKKIGDEYIIEDLNRKRMK